MKASEWTIATGLGEQEGLNDTVRGVRMLPGAFSPGETEFDIEVLPGTAFVINSFFVFGELYDNGEMDNPNDPIIDVILETTDVRTTLNGDVILEGSSADLEERSFGPTAFDEPIEYAEPQERGEDLNSIAAKFVLGTGGLLPPLSPGEHTLENEVDSEFFGKFDITYNITVATKGKGNGSKGNAGKSNGKAEGGSESSTDTLNISESGQRIPFRISGGGNAPNGLPLVPGGEGPHTSTGTASHLGKHSGSGVFTLGELNISEAGEVSGTFQGVFKFVAANGDVLATTYGDGFTGKFTGQLSEDGTSVVGVEFDAFFAPNSENSTGRFSKIVGGGWRMIATSESISLVGGAEGFTAPFDYEWSGIDSLLFAKKSKN